MIVDGWLDWATRIDGIPVKVYSTPNAGLGIACHSIVGREDEFQDGIPNRFLSTEGAINPATGRFEFSPAAAASCMFVLRESGELIQMYPVAASTWTSGGFEGNTRYWAIEAEGGLYPNYGEQLTPAAADTFIRLATEFEQHTGLPAVPNGNVLQHRQIAAMYDYAPTACASGRYDTAWARLAAGERFSEMTPAQQEEHDALVAIFGGRDRLLAAQEQGQDYLLGYAIEQTDQDQLESAVAALQAAGAGGAHGAIPEHTHEPGKVRQ